MMVQNSIDNEDLEVVDGSMEVIMHTSREEEYVFEEKDFNYNVDEELHQVVELEAKEGCSSDSNATILWKHVIKGRKCGNAHGGSHVFKCKHCKKVYNGSYTRVFAHLMGHKKGENKGIGYCPVVKADANLQQLLKRQVEQIESSPNVVPLKKSKLKLASSSISSHGPSPAISLPPSPSSPTGLLDKLVQIEEKDVDSKVLHFLCANGISLNVLRSPYWEDMIKAISKVPGYASPSYDRARTVLLHNERERVESNSKLETLKVAMTRFASFYTCMKRLFDVKEALRDMVVSDKWKAWESLPVLDTNVKLTGADVRAEVMSDEFWESVQLALLMTKPMYRMIKFIDQEGPLIGELYDNMENMIVEIRDNLREAEFDIHSNVDKIVHNRWNKVDTPLHCLAHALTPKYYDEEFLQNAAPGVRKRVPPDQDIDIMDGAMDAIFKMHSDIDQADTIRVQFMAFSEKKAGYNIGPHRKWDVNPEHPIVDDSLAKWEDMRFDGLDGLVLEPSPQPCNSIEEHDDMTLGED
ncbi:hypothetical protein QJS10_CPB14g00090 [Acorus calamus]|uniref:BED-type domain-containing protein n=1 Tax=Acorus calamus TaxID=4465 RepID=A0AAV9DB23_ACOCL|nr:hypothetical protein QJS10_CPB14g00090 [Acorus calamus]